MVVGSWKHGMILDSVHWWEKSAPKKFWKFLTLLVAAALVAAVYVTVVLMAEERGTILMRIFPPATCEQAQAQKEVEALSRIPTTAGSYIPGEMPYQSKSGTGLGHLAPCITAAGEGATRAETNRETSFYVNIDRVCARKQGIELKDDSTTFFYVRLVGPSIVPGNFEWMNRTTFRIFYEVYDPGLYSLQVAVEFATVWGVWDRKFFSQITHLEGKEIRGSPFSLAVSGPPRASPQTLRLCEVDEIGGAHGRWVLNKRPESGDARRETRVNFLDAEYTWLPLACRMPTQECMAVDRVFKRCYGEQKMTVYMFGDSLMGIQLREFYEVWKDQQWDKRIWAWQQDTSGGIAEQQAGINKTIDKAVEHGRKTGGAVMLWFNSGLHDIDKYCGQTERPIEWRASHGYVRDYDCLGEYVRLTKQVIAKVEESGYDGPKVFRSTTASWMKFGNHHVEWNKFQDVEQEFVQSRYIVEAFNKNVLPLYKAAGWRIVDGYASTVARPDRAEIANKGGGFVHFEKDIVDLHNKQMMAVGLMHQCRDIMLDECS